MVRLASPKQIAFIDRLAKERDEHDIFNQMDGLVWERYFDALGGKDVTMAEAGQVIDALLKIAKKNAAPKAAPAPEGMHRLGDRIFKVQRAVHGSGNVYAKELVRNGEESDGEGFHFEYAPGIVKQLSTETLMTLEEATAWGALYGTCCVCGATLTDDESIARGIGPVCARKF